MSNHRLYEHSVIDVCMTLHGCDLGSGDGMSNERRAELVDWLRWRVSHWIINPSRIGHEVDHTVLNLAIAVLAQADACT